MNRKIIIYILMIILFFIIILLSGQKLLVELISSEKKIVVSNQNSEIIQKVKECFYINKDIKEIKYSDDFDGFNLYIYDNNNNKDYIHVEKPNEIEKEIGEYFSKLKKQYNKINIFTLIFSIVIEFYIIYKIIDSMNGKAHKADTKENVK